MLDYDEGQQQGADRYTGSASRDPSTPMIGRSAEHRPGRGASEKACHIDGVHASAVLCRDPEDYSLAYDLIGLDRGIDEDRQHR